MSTTMAVTYKLEGTKPDGTPFYKGFGFKTVPLSPSNLGDLERWVVDARRGMRHWTETLGITGWRWTKNGQPWDPASGA